MSNRICAGSGRERRNLPRRELSQRRRRAVLHSRVRALQKQVRVLAAALALLCRAADRLEADVQEGHAVLPDNAGPAHQPGSPKPPQTLTPVVTLELKMQADRRVGVIVNGKMAFTLSPTLGAVLSILCSYSTAAKASNVPATYLDYAMISARLCAVAGSRPPSVHVVVNYIYRLRAAFEAHKFDPTFIRRAPHLGVRLVLSSRAPALPPAADIGSPNAPPAPSNTRELGQGRKETP